MRKIPTTFKKYGHDFKIERRTGDKAIYSRNDGESYEVVKIMHLLSRKIGNTVLEAGEYLPSSEHWGRYGWTFSKLSQAVHKYEEI